MSRWEGDNLAWDTPGLPTGTSRCSYLLMTAAAGMSRVTLPRDRGSQSSWLAKREGPRLWSLSLGACLEGTVSSGPCQLSFDEMVRPKLLPGPASTALHPIRICLTQLHWDCKARLLTIQVHMMVLWPMEAYTTCSTYLHCRWYIACAAVHSSMCASLIWMPADDSLKMFSNVSDHVLS